MLIAALILPILGMFPHQSMDAIAAMTLGSMNAHAGEAVAYFSLTNLKGALISIVIGAAVYFGFVRTWLMSKQADGSTVYVDRWPAWLNLENGVYRPLLLHVLPFIGALVSRVIASIPEWLIKLSRRFIFNQENGVVIPPEDDKITIAALDPDKAQSINLAKSLVLFGLGMTIAMLYLIF